ncbi:MAG: hypothetical protein J7K40_12930 [candidate division Zixibacteria bacterium]|nr:hypothetical protein [candidate division Zixibacteria bacterium]
MLAKYIILSCLAGIIEIIFLGLGKGTSLFSIFAALVIVFLSVRIMGKAFVNGRIIRLAVWFSVMNIALGNIPLAVAKQTERLKPLSAEFDGQLLSLLSMVFKGSFDSYLFFWISQNIFFTGLFLVIFIIFSKLIRRFENGISTGTIQN